jgi:hypothetical protein
LTEKKMGYWVMEDPYVTYKSNTWKPFGGFWNKSTRFDVQRLHIQPYSPKQEQDCRRMK